PLRQWVNANVLAGEARDIKVFAVLLFYQPPKLSRNFQTAFDIDTRCVISSQHTFEPNERSIGGWPTGKVLLIGVATRLDPLPTTFDHPRSDTTLHITVCQYFSLPR